MDETETQDIPADWLEAVGSEGPAPESCPDGRKPVFVWQSYEVKKACR